MRCKFKTSSIFKHKMKTTKRVGILLAALIPLTSCEQLANNPELAGMLGAVGGGAVGNLIGQQTNSRNGPLVGTLIGAGVGAIIAYSIAKSYKADQQQKAIAASRARSGMSAARKKDAKYVAVRVPAKNGVPAGIVKVNAQTGQAQDKVVIPSASNLKAGQVVKLGGDKTYLYDSWSQGV
jgi:uncharacterized membrane protein YeaQ/YmgE (transglycosylase-associated protein family)